MPPIKVVSAYRMRSPGHCGRGAEFPQDAREKEDDSMSSANSSVLVAYFSHSGTTREAAKQVKEMTGGDLFEIVAAESYPRDYGAVVERAKKELAEKRLPELKEGVEDMTRYGTVFLGYPNWCDAMPRPVAAFLARHDISGKRVAPFCTHEGTGLGRSVAEVRELCPRSMVLHGLAVRGGNAGNAQKEISGWLTNIIP